MMCVDSIVLIYPREITTRKASDLEVPPWIFQASSPRRWDYTCAGDQIQGMLDKGMLAKLQPVAEAKSLVSILRTGTISLCCLSRPQWAIPQQFEHSVSLASSSPRWTVSVSPSCSLGVLINLFLLWQNTREIQLTFGACFRLIICCGKN